MKERIFNAFLSFFSHDFTIFVNTNRIFATPGKFASINLHKEIQYAEKRGDISRRRR